MPYKVEKLVPPSGGNPATGAEKAADLEFWMTKALQFQRSTENLSNKVDQLLAENKVLVERLGET